MQERNDEYSSHDGEYTHNKTSIASQEEFNFDKERIERELFFACEICSNALVQDSLCIVCKKTLSRICVGCACVKPVGDHRKCLSVILINMKRAEGKKL